MQDHSQWKSLDPSVDANELQQPARRGVHPHRRRESQGGPEQEGPGQSGEKRTSFLFGVLTGFSFYGEERDKESEPFPDSETPLLRGLRLSPMEPEQ